MFELDKETKYNIENFFTHEVQVLEETIKKALNTDCLLKLIKVQTTDTMQKSGFFGKFNIDIDGVELGLYISMDAKLASILADLMLMGPGQEKDLLEAEDVDSLNELFSQSFGSFATLLRESGYKARFNGFSDAELKTDNFFESECEIILTDIAEGSFYQYVSIDEFEKVLDNLKVNVESQSHEISSEPIFEIQDTPTQNHSQEVSKDNLNLLMDIELNARVRIGSKQMLLKDIVKLSEGTIIDLDKNVDEPMEILVNGKIIAKGIVVVVGGNFGIKITHVGTKEDRIKSLGG